MMNTQQLEAMLCQTLCANTAVVAREDGCWRVSTPFVFPDGDAYTLYLRAHVNRRKKLDTTILETVKLAEQAVQLDPHFALGWAELAQQYLDAAGGAQMPVETGVAKAREAVLRALAIEPDLPEAYVALAEIQYTHDFDWSAARQSLGRARALSPGSVEVMLSEGRLAYTRPTLDEALALFGEAVSCDPLDSRAAFVSQHASEQVVGELLSQARLSLVRLSNFVVKSDPCDDESGRVAWVYDNDLGFRNDKLNVEGLLPLSRSGHDALAAIKDSGLERTYDLARRLRSGADLTFETLSLGGAAGSELEIIAAGRSVLFATPAAATLTAAL